MFQGEINVLKFLEGIRTDFLNQVFEFVTMLGEETLLVIILAILYFAVDKHFARKILFISVFSLSINCIVKNVVKLPRPFKKWDITCVREGTATGYSFPSGHTQTFAAWSTGAIVAVKKYWLLIISFVLTFLVAFSRLYLGAHYPSDVIAGALSGIVIAIVMNIVYDKIKNKSRLYLIVIILLTPFAVFWVINPDVLFEDFYKVYGMLTGFWCATMFEERFVKFDCNTTAFKKTARVLIGLITALVVKWVMKFFVISENTAICLMMDAVRYFVLIFVTLGLCPWFFKKFKL